MSGDRKGVESAGREAVGAGEASVASEARDSASADRAGSATSRTPEVSADRERATSGTHVVAGSTDRSAAAPGEQTAAADAGVIESGNLEASRSGDRTTPTAAAGTGADDRETAAESGLGGQVRRQRTALLTLGIIGAILIGFAIGVLARIPLNGSTEPDPGPVDVGFGQDMSAHHAQAVEMAGVLLVRSTDTEVRRLAYDILTTQQSQIGRMQGWLQLWGEPAQSVDGFMGWMAEPMGGHDHSGADMPHHSGPVSTMPGMATPAELAALRQATSPKLDTMFLQLMLRHHQGGLSMIDYAAQHADTTAVRTLAETMATTQRGESDLMTTMLTARGAAPLP